jgi:hypothetical protein
MADGGAGRTATSHRMTKRTSQGVAQASRAPRGRREWAKLSPTAANQRRPCRAVLFAGGRETSKYSWLVGCLGRRSDGGPRSGSCAPILWLG